MENTVEQPPTPPESLSEVERLKRRLEGFKQHYEELKCVRAKLARARAELILKCEHEYQAQARSRKLMRVLDKIADLEPELITVPQIIGYVKRALERL